MKNRKNENRKIQEKMRHQNILEVFILELIIVLLMYGIVLFIKALGVSGGTLTKLVPFISILTVTYLTAKYKDKMTLADLGITFSKQEIILTILFILLSLLPMFCGSIDRVSNNSLLFNIGYFLIVGVAEEVFYRGYIKCKLRTCPVLIWRFVSAILFAALHTISSEKLTPIIVIYLLSAGFIFAVVRDCITSLISIILFHSAWDIGSSYSDNYSNIIWIILIWLLFIIIAKVHYIIINKLRYQKMR